MDSVNPKWKRNPPSDTLFVKNLSFGTSEGTSYHRFDGDSNIRIVTDQESGESRGFGYMNIVKLILSERCFQRMTGKSEMLRYNTSIF